MSKKTVAILFGGRSPEYDVSLMSAYSIINAVNRDKYDILLLGITREGEWFRYSGSVDDIPNDMWHTDPSRLSSMIISPSKGGGLIELIDGRAEKIHADVVFPVLHGSYGEDGTVQGLCELAGIPVVGSGSAASALCMDKDRAHKLVSLAGIRVPKSICFEYAPSEEEILSTISQLGLPLFVKPVKAGSSFGVTRVDDSSQLMDAVKLALTYDDAVLFEENIDGFETGCSVIGNLELKTGRIDEIELAGGFFDYEEKYNLVTSKIHMPARIDEETEKKLQEAAKTIYTTLGCRGYARIDIFLDSKGEIVFNETNTIPGFTSKSRFPNMLKGVGIEYPELVDILIELAIEYLEK
ncbi:MAG: D-alanine--D-serine ligase VanG [Oscillospiraceae bacterium]|nr:D-alanine--D-serine ligase VanG [Oscillospiraceae bacterium]